jgi:[protein-PII] uridylyltransferase
MQRYYWAAKTVTQLNTILLQNIEAQLFPQDAVAVPINAASTTSATADRHRANDTPSSAIPRRCWRCSC